MAVAGEVQLREVHPEEFAVRRTLVIVGEVLGVSVRPPQSWCYVRSIDIDGLHGHADCADHPSGGRQRRHQAS